MLTSFYGLGGTSNIFQIITRLSFYHCAGPAASASTTYILTQWVRAIAGIDAFSLNKLPVFGIILVRHLTFGWKTCPFWRSIGLAAAGPARALLNSIENSVNNYPRYLQESSKIQARFWKNFTRFWQELSKNLARFLQNPWKILG